MTTRARQITCLVVATLLAGCSSPNAPQHASSVGTSRSAPSSQTTTDSRAAARSVVERFGKRMQEISVLAPPDAVRAELPKAYGGLLSPALLKTWQAHPDQIIGREGSSPWPDRIEVKRLDCNADSCSVSGDVDYITSNEVAHGGVFMRRPISLELADAAHGWHITAVRLETARE